MKENKFLVVSAGYNCASYVGLNLSILQKQTYKNYTHIVINDASTDGTDSILKEFSDDKTIVIHNATNLGWLQSTTRHLEVDDSDIVLIVDLDDWLLHDHVLEILNKIYAEEDCWMTYGSFIWMTKKVIEGREYPSSIIKTKRYREYDWLAVHPQTFRGFLWNNINKKDFKNENGIYLRACYDQAVMLPILEMCRTDKIRFIDEPLYVYNDHNPLNLMKIKKEYQIECENTIRSKSKYKELSFEDSSIYS